MKKLLVILCLFLLSGCSVEFKGEHETNLENIQTCLNSGGSPKATYCKHSDTICTVECFYDKED